MSYNGEAFVYDLIGNPTTYRGKSATWSYGRELTTFDGNTFSYDARGRRTAKNNITFIYDSNGNLVKQSNGLEFFYDHSGVFAIKYNNSTYFYRKNAQNDIIAILDTNGAVVVKYKYDAWGNCQVVSDTSGCNLGTLNPFRYRSYYYDTETNLYFLKTRYYDPELGRFMTIDDISYLDPDSINGLNLYAYCKNNPIKYEDPNGTFAITTALLIVLGIGAGIGALSGAIISGATYAIEHGGTDSFSWQGLAAATLGGLVSGLISGAVTVACSTMGPVGVVVGGAIGGFIGGFTGSIVQSSISRQYSSVGDVFCNALGNAVWGAIGGALGGLISGPGGASAGTIVTKFLKHPIKNFLIDFGETLIMDFSNWYSQFVTEGIIERYA